MKPCRTLTITLFLTLALQLQGAEPNSPEEPKLSSESKVVKDLYPNIEMGFLSDAVVSDLPKGVLLKSDDLTISEKDITQVIADANEEIQPQLKKYASMVLEQVALPKLLAKEIKNEAAENDIEITGNDENKIIQDYFSALATTIKVSEEQILEFYNDNKESLSGAEYEQVKAPITKLLIQEYLQKIVDTRIRTIGTRMKIEVSASWLKTQSILELDNPVSKARNSGKPTMVDFGSKGCVPCEMLAPILEILKEKYDGKANIVVIQVDDEPILSSLYGIEVIPVQIFYDKTGKEVFRHSGYFPQEEIEKHLSDIGVK